MHLHWYSPVRKGRGGNAYLACRCGSREIRHPDRSQPLDYRWLETGRFAEEPTRSPVPPSRPSPTHATKYGV
jgi:hypothetical protein